MCREKFIVRLKYSEHVVCGGDCAHVTDGTVLLADVSEYFGAFIRRKRPDVRLHAVTFVCLIRQQHARAAVIVTLHPQLSLVTVTCDQNQMTLGIFTLTRNHHKL